MVGINITNSIFSSAFKASMDYDYTDVNIKYKPVLKFSVGGIADYAYTDKLSFRSGLLVNLKGTHVKISDRSSGGSENSSEKITCSYIEIPLWVAYRIADTGFLLTGGPNIGFAVSAKSKSKGSYSYNGYTESLSSTDNLEIGGDAYSDAVKPLDISLNIGVAKEIMLAERALEVSVNIQPSLSKWTTASKIESSLWGRHFVVGLRAAYFFSFK